VKYMEKESLDRVAQRYRDEGYEVVVAESGRDGIEAIAAIAFDAVIVDIFMPYMDGLRTIEALNRHAPDVPVIALSGLMLRKSSALLQPTLGEPTGLQVACALQKPFRPRDLLSAIEACVCQETVAACSREPQSPTARHLTAFDRLPTAEVGHQSLSSAG